MGAGASVGVMHARCLQSVTWEVKAVLRTESLSIGAGVLTWIVLCRNAEGYPAKFGLGGEKDPASAVRPLLS